MTIVLWLDLVYHSKATAGPNFLSQEQANYVLDVSHAVGHEDGIGVHAAKEGRFVDPSAVLQEHGHLHEASGRENAARFWRRVL